jgi:hypothetical protein
MALAARIASPQGVAFHTSTDTAPAEKFNFFEFFYLSSENFDHV